MADQASQIQPITQASALVMAIININDDSFCGDGSLDSKNLVEQAVRAIEQGADIIDVGAESARTNRKAIPVSEEVRRFSMFLQFWDEIKARAKARDKQQLWPPQLSLNTWRSEVIERVLPLGGDILNDISGLPDSTNAELAFKYQAKLLIMHTVGEPKVAHTEAEWPDVMSSIQTFFEEKVSMALAAGLSKEELILDPGVDFAKQCEHNLELYARLEELQRFDCPILLPVSRKTVIGDVLGIENPIERDPGTMACIVNGLLKGASLFRVHNVAASFDTIRMCQFVASKDKGPRF